MSTSEFERLVNLRAWSNAVVNQPREEGRDRRVVAGAIGLYQRCTPHTFGLLRAQRERPRSRAAERGQEFSSSDVACHVTLRLGVIHALEDDTTLPTAALRDFSPLFVRFGSMLLKKDFEGDL